MIGTSSAVVNATTACPEPGLGVPCRQAQCDGVPCPQLNVDCATCAKAREASETLPTRQPREFDA